MRIPKARFRPGDEVYKKTDGSGPFIVLEERRPSGTWGGSYFLSTGAYVLEDYLCTKDELPRLKRIWTDEEKEGLLQAASRNCEELYCPVCNTFVAYKKVARRGKDYADFFFHCDSCINSYSVSYKHPAHPNLPAMHRINCATHH